MCYKTQSTGCAQCTLRACAHVFCQDWRARWEDPEIIEAGMTPTLTWGLGLKFKPRKNISVNEIYQNINTKASPHQLPSQFLEVVYCAEFAMRGIVQMYSCTLCTTSTLLCHISVIQFGNRLLHHRTFKGFIKSTKRPRRAFVHSFQKMIQIVFGIISNMK